MGVLVEFMALLAKLILPYHALWLCFLSVEQGGRLGRSEEERRASRKDRERGRMRKKTRGVEEECQRMKNDRRGRTRKNEGRENEEE
jgi:hypothetical protein